MRGVVTVRAASRVHCDHGQHRTTKRVLVNHLYPSRRGLHLVNNDHRRPQDDEPGEYEGVMIHTDGTKDFALAEINRTSGGEPPSRATKAAGMLLLLALAALVVSATARGIVWMWS